MLGQKKCSRKSYFAIRLSPFHFFQLRANKKAKLLNGNNTETDGQTQKQQLVGSVNNNEINNNHYYQQHYQQHQQQHYIQNGSSRNPNHYQQLQHNGTGNGISYGSISNSSNDGHYKYSLAHHPHYQPLKHQTDIYGFSAESNYELTNYGATGISNSNISHNTVTGTGRPGGPNLVNKQLVLPFVLPSFPNNSQDGITHLIKPSEYLKSISDKRSCTSSTRSTDTEDYMQIQVNNQHHCVAFEPPKPPPPPPLPLASVAQQNQQIGNNNNNNYCQNNFNINNNITNNTINPQNENTVKSSVNNTDTALRKQHQPLSAISVQDLNSVQLRRIDTQKVPKPYQMPARSLSMQCLSSTTDTYLHSDLIAELKVSKDIPGIKKMKVEKQLANRFDSEHYSEISKQFIARNFIDQIPERDQSSNIIPEWKRQMMAKKLAEKAKLEFEERILKEAENRRLSQIPQWKRDLLARREETENKFKIAIYTPKVEENNRIADTWRLRSRAMSIDNISTVSCAMELITDNNHDNSNNKENYVQIENKIDTSNDCKQKQQQQKTEHIDEGNDNIIPWRAQLRKTNSRLSLI